MKKTLLLLILSWLLVNIAPAQIYQQYFDGADTSILNSVLVDFDTNGSNTWQIGPPQKIVFDSAATLPNAMVTDTLNTYPPDDTSRFIAKVSLSGGNWGIFALQWMQKLDMDASFDGGIVEYSLDTGQTWINIMFNPYVYNFYGFDTLNIDTLPGGEFAFSGTDSSWKNIWVCFDYSWLMLFGMNDTLLFRFSLISDGIDNFKEGWILDNMISNRTYIHTVKEKEPVSYLRVYPNPANDIVYIEAAKLMEFHIIEKMELVDLLGKTLDTWTNIPTKFWIKTDSYPSGQYFLKVQTNLRTEILPLIIQKP